METFAPQLQCFGSNVAVAKLSRASHSEQSVLLSEMHDAVRRLSKCMKWDCDASPLGAVIQPGARVLIKPNLVLHQNEGCGGIEPLVTNPTLIRAVVEAALKADPLEVTIGDAPIQSCDLDMLLHETGLRRWADALSKRDRRFKGIRDFRRTTCVVLHGVRRAADELQSKDKFTICDLGKDSLLEPITDDDERFRVTWYDPRLLARTHRRGVHQYLVARQVLDSDVVINLPKLKTHKKAGLTCALKNSIGINGNKEYLPHHRFGGSKTGGDCYPGGSRLKLALEHLADRQNMSFSNSRGMFWRSLGLVLTRLSLLQGDRFGIDGSWSGNDTIWRTCLDMNRILLYARSNGEMDDSPQRRVIHIVDSVVAGHGNGPLAPEPLPLGLLFASDNAAAMDVVAAQVLGYEPSKIPLVWRCFDSYRWPLAPFEVGAVRVIGDCGEGHPQEIIHVAQRVKHPLGWRMAASRTRTEKREEVLYEAGDLPQSWDA
jgi:uncharacterized protein (DUF362 family)